LEDEVKEEPIRSPGKYILFHLFSPDSSSSMYITENITFNNFAKELNTQNATQWYIDL